MILTDASGVPLVPPEPLKREATIEDKITWLRESAAYSDRVHATAHRAFDASFRKAVRKERVVKRRGVEARA